MQCVGFFAAAAAVNVLRLTPLSFPVAILKNSACRTSAGALLSGAWRGVAQHR